MKRITREKVYRVRYAPLLLFAMVLPASQQPMIETIIEKLPSFINTPYDETNPILSEDGSTLYFTRVGHPSFTKALVNNFSDIVPQSTYKKYQLELERVYRALGSQHTGPTHRSKFNQDVWIAQGEEGQFVSIDHPDYPLNNALPNSVCAITTDPNKVIVVNQFFADGSMRKGFSIVSRVADGWSFPKPLYIYDYESLDDGVNLSLSRDNEVMILSLNNEHSLGKPDLFVSFRVHTTLWSAPLHMGDIVNSPSREVTPYISNDKKYILFASDRRSPDTDIYLSERLDDSWVNWSLPRRLSAPINSRFNDAQPFLHQPSQQLYFSSTRDGSSDIFRIAFNPELASNTPIAVAQIPKVTSVSNEIRCLIVDSQTGMPVEASVAFRKSKDSPIEQMTISEQGLKMDLVASATCYFKAEKPHYLAREVKVDPQVVLSQPNKEIRIPIDPLTKGTRITINPIRFLRGRDQILKPSHAELDHLAGLLHRHPKMQIQVAGHTDNVGDHYSLLQLSQSRSRAIKRYLVKSGVQAHRISTRGYGPSHPLNDNSSEKLRAQNRRVEIIITKAAN